MAIAAQAEIQGLVSVLREDAELARTLSLDERRVAWRGAIAPLLVLEAGSYGPDTFASYDGQFGVLVLQGVLVRQVVVAGRLCGELLDKGSLVRPWDRSGEDAPLPYDTCWRVLEPARLAILTPQFMAAVGRWPGVTGALIERAIDRSHRLALSVAIHSLEHVELRLLVLLWHLADRLGRVTRAGTLIPLALTHADLAQLVGAQRPSVSTALAALTARGRVRRGEDHSWVLLGSPPAEVRDLKRRQGDWPE